MRFADETITAKRRKPGRNGSMGRLVQPTRNLAPPAAAAARREPVELWRREALRPRAGAFGRSIRRGDAL